MAFRFWWGVKPFVQHICDPQVCVGSSLDAVFMVMEYADHDLKAVMDARMKQPFSVAEVRGPLGVVLDLGAECMCAIVLLALG